MIKIFTDGGFIKDKNVAGWAFAAYDNDECFYYQSGILTEDLQHWNIAGELEAVFQATAWSTDKYTEYELHYDYAGIEQWATGNWKANNPLTIRYSEFMQAQKDKVNIVFVKVKGHSGIAENEFVDKLCTEAMNQFGKEQKSKEEFKCPICGSKLLKFDHGRRDCSNCPAVFGVDGKIKFIPDCPNITGFSWTEYLGMLADAINQNKLTPKKISKS